MFIFKNGSRLCPLIIGIGLFLSICMPNDAPAFFQEDTTHVRGYSGRPTTGKHHAFAIYCSDSTVTTLPSYWYNHWGNNYFAIGGFLLEMSDSTCSLDCDPYAYGSRPFCHDGLRPSPGWCNSGGPGFADSILKTADPHIDYAKYDKDNDGFVDGFFFIIIDSSTVGGCDGVNCDYLSNDTLANGQRVRVYGYYGVEIRIRAYSNLSFTNCDDFVHICVHEWGHQFGLNDLYCYCNLRGIGLSAMGNDHVGERCPPYDPYSRARLGWVEPITVEDSLMDQPIANHLLTGDVYELRCSGPLPPTPSHYFLVSNHTNLEPPSWWEGAFPGSGLLIWHITPEGDNSAFNEIPEVDVEGADGLWDYTQTPPVRDDSTGRDSIDLGYLGVYHSFWNESTKTAFDDTSSPNTRDYIRVITEQDTVIKQTIYTGVWIRNIEGQGGDTMYADLFSPFIDWGPNEEVQLSGDYTLDSIYTLTIQPGTDVVLDTTDGQSSGYDTTKCEFIVQGRLVAAGASCPNPCAKNTRFKSSSHSPQPGDWHGIVVESSGSAHLENVAVKDAYCGAFFDHAAHHHKSKVKNCYFSGNQLYGIKSSHSKVAIVKNWITGVNPGYGIYIDNPAADVRNNTIDSAQYGIYVRAVNGASTTISYNDITGVGYRGVHVQDVLVDLQNPTTTLMSYNDVDGYFSDCHLYLNNANLLHVENSRFRTGPAAGIGSCRSPTGIKAIDSDGVKVRSSQIKDYCLQGFYASSQTTADLGIHAGDPGDNFFTTSYVPIRFRVYAVVNQGTDTLKAEDNYWGTDDPPDTMFSGPVDYDPWLSGPPGQGKIHAAEDDSRPKEFALSHNYPNPFNPHTVLGFTLPEASRVSLKVYNLLGELVKRVVNQELPAGTHSVTWHGDNESGRAVASGIYFYVLKAGNFRAAKKMVLLR
jgi:M6 family metalloprotease-like protein